MNTPDQDVYVYPAGDEYPRPIGDDPDWQESMLVHWWDEKNGIGGMHRIAHEAHRAGGRAVLFFGIVTREGLRFNRYHNLQARPEDRFEDGLQVTSAYRMTFGDGPRLRVSDDGCELDLRFEDTMPRVDLVARPDTKTFGVLAPSHFEVAGRVGGTVSLKGKKYEIDGLCIRDHSWGMRDWGMLLGHRWVAGWFGPNVSFAFGSVLLAQGGLTAFGLLARNGLVSYAKRTEIIAHSEMDGLSHRGGVIHFEMEDGEHIEINAYSPVDGIAFMHNGLMFAQEICSARMGDLEGHCTFEISTRSCDSEALTKALVRAAIQQGWSRRSGTL